MDDDGDRTALIGRRRVTERRLDRKIMFVDRSARGNDAIQLGQLIGIVVGDCVFYYRSVDRVDADRARGKYFNPNARKTAAIVLRKP